MFKRIPFEKVHWITSSFLIGTLFLSLTAVPLYIWHFGLDWFQIALFFVMISACGFSITLGYHRMFSHLAFQAHRRRARPSLIFGAGAFENSALMWSCEHRTHHKHVDHDEDPYDITKGLFHAHMGWLMFKLKPSPPFDNVADLKKDWMVMLQHQYIHWIAASCRLRPPDHPRVRLGRLALGPRRIAHRRRGPRRRSSALHFLHQFALPLHRQAPVLLPALRARFVAHGRRHLRRRLPQLSPRVSARLPQWREALAVRSHEVDHLDALQVRPGQESAPRSSEKILLAELAEAQRRLETELASPGLTDAASAFLRSACHRLQATAQRWKERKAEQLGVTRANAHRTSQ